jgi:hypothetical protein
MTGFSDVMAAVDNEKTMVAKGMGRKTTTNVSVVR